MRILLTGSNGQVGTEFCKLGKGTTEIISTGSRELDLTREQEVRRFVRDAKPNVIVNAAAFSDVDLAERNWDACFAINAIAPMVLAEEAHRLDALLIHYSTDHVFDGNKARAIHGTGSDFAAERLRGFQSSRGARDRFEFCAGIDPPC